MDIKLHPFELHGYLPETPVNRQEWGRRKFGAASFDAVHRNLAQQFQAVGIDYPCVRGVGGSADGGKRADPAAARRCRSSRTRTSRTG